MLLNYQTLVTELTGMEMANASLLVRTRRPESRVDSSPPDELVGPNLSRRGPKQLKIEQNTSESLVRRRRRASTPPFHAGRGHRRRGGHEHVRRFIEKRQEKGRDDFFCG